MKLSSKDTPQRTAGLAPPKQDSRSKTKEPVDSFFDASDPFPVNTFGEESIFFAGGMDDQFMGTSNPFFVAPPPSAKKSSKQFDPRNYKTEAGR